ncbi:MAG: sulfotransferase [Phaeodactylibacter sp.]|nr:sulfotransferase [Phaeodactylibacter sp.]
MSSKASDKPVPIILLAYQRSGTTVLQRTMGTSPLVHNFGEVFLGPKPADKVKEYYDDWNLYAKTNFFNFKEKAVAENPALLLPSPENQKMLFGLFLDRLAKSTTKKYFIADVKYHSWHHLNIFFQEIFHPPFLLRMLLEQEVKFIHLIRKNVFEQYVSWIYSKATRKWHYKRKETLRKQKITIDVRDCEARMRLSLDSTRVFEGWLSGASCLTLYYESLFEDGRFSPEVLSKIEGHIGEKLSLPDAPVLKKVISNVGGVVKNREEVLQYFKDTPYEKYTRSLCNK